LSAEQRLDLLRAFLRRARKARLPEACREPWSFWIYTLASGALDRLFVAFTAGDHGLPGSSFGYFDDDLSLAYVEALGMHQTRGLETIRHAGRSPDARERLLGAFHRWNDAGQPGMEALSITARRDGEGRWQCDLAYDGVLVGRELQLSQDRRADGTEIRP
jgi:hypothetical protein